MLPDDVLLSIFVFCADEDLHWKKEIEAWQSLVHVCRRWRLVVFGSPTRLNLRLACTAKTPARAALDIWPPLPLVIQDGTDPQGGLDNIIAVLERRNRVRIINLVRVSNSQLETLSEAMQEPFPGLTDLQLWSHGDVVLPDSFLGGSAPRLRFLWLNRTPFPGLPKLLLSATHLVDLFLEDIPHSGYISPGAMVTVLSTLTRLEVLVLEFQSHQSRPDQATRHLPPPTRSLLSILRSFAFKGDNEYLEDFLARIDAPRLYNLHTTFFNDIVFETPQFIQFIRRAPWPKAPGKVNVIFEDDTATVILPSLTYGELLVKISSCREPDWRVLFLVQVFTTCLPPLSTLEDLYIYEGTSSQAHWQDNVENGLWLELLRPFRTVKNLYLDKEFARHIAPALQDLVKEGDTGVLPTLQNIYLEGFQPSGRGVQEGIAKFVAARRVTNYPVEVVRWFR
jgi:hypothetical protein